MWLPLPGAWTSSRRGWSPRAGGGSSAWWARLRALGAAEVSLGGGEGDYIWPGVPEDLPGVVASSELLRDAGTGACRIGWVQRERFYGRLGYVRWRSYRMASRRLGGR